MARYSSGMTATIAGTSLRPIFGLLNAAAVTGVVREIGIFNTTSTSCVYRLVRLTGGTAGADQTEAKLQRDTPTASCVAKAGWTADATIDEDLGYRAVLGAAAGSGTIWTFGADGLETHDVGTTKGIGLVPVGTGQICEVYLVWDE
jgi:hypothetical protein